MIQLMRQQAMTAAMSRQKINLPAMHFPADERIGRRTERRLDPLLGRIFDPFHLIQSASADDADRWFVVCHGVHLRIRHDQGEVDNGAEGRVDFCRRASSTQILRNVAPMRDCSFVGLVLALLPRVLRSTHPRRNRPRPSAQAAAAETRPGLGTRWGETRNSPVVVTAFRRARGRPVAVAAIYYNDLPGIAAMAGSSAPRRTWPIIAGPAGALVAAGLRDESGRFLPGLLLGNRWFVVGEKGHRYSIVVRNRSDLRLEIVLSVDGLNVMDGRPASFHKRGHVLQPHGEIHIDGFRQSYEEVAAFRFGSVRESYANRKYGDARNVGVIGIAIFNERGTDPWQTNEMLRRLKANPFPGDFATPP